MIANRWDSSGLDPDDCSVIYAYVRNKWVKCISEMYSIFKGRSRREVAMATAELFKMNKISNKAKSITAKRIAMFLERAEESELVISQRIKDEERRRSRQHLTPAFGKDIADKGLATDLSSESIADLPDEKLIQQMDTF